MTRKKEKITLNDLLCIFYFALPVLQGTVFQILPHGGYLMLLSIISLTALVIIKESNGLVRYADIIVLYALMAVLLGTAFWLDPARRIWLTRDFGVKSAVLGGGIFVYPAVRLQKTPEQFYRNLKISFVLRGAYYAYMVLEPIRKGYWQYEQFGVIKRSPSHMTWSYGVLLVISVLSIMAIREKRRIYFVPVGLGLIGILLYGSRGTIVCYAIGAALYILFGERKQLELKKIVIILLALAFVAFVFSDLGVSAVEMLAQRTGIKSRFITTYLNMMQGDKSMDSESNGRDRIWALVLSMIREKPLGYGPMGHRTAIYRIGIKWGYSHNLFLDWLAEYGVIFGSMMIIGLFFMIIRLFRKSFGFIERMLLVLMITVSCEMLFSSYYWIHFGIWAMLALYLNHFKDNWQQQSQPETKDIVQVLVAEEII